MKITHKKLTAACATVALLVTACGGTLSSTTQTQTGTAKNIYNEALKLAQLEYPGAYLIGYNNYGDSFEKPTALPASYETSGVTGNWIYLFTKSREALTDGTITKDETFSVHFSAGTITVVEETGVDEYTVTSDVAFGADLLAFDSDALYSKALDAITKKAPAGLKPLHVDFRITPGVDEVTIFTTTASGYTARFDMKKGEVTTVDQAIL